MSGEQQRGRRMLVLLAAVFLAPLALAWLAYRGPVPWYPGGQVNHGRLVDPALPLPALRLPVIAGEPPRGELLDERWSLIILTGDGCGEDCREALAGTQRIQALLGRDRDRVQRLLIVTGARPELEPPDPMLLALDGSGAAGREWLAAAGEPREEGAVWVVDPLGNLVLVFEAGSDMQGLHHDLRRLLKLSSIG